MAEPTPQKSSGLDPKVAGLIAWILAPLASLIFVLIEKDNKTTKFHAWQSLFGGIALVLIGIVLSPFTLGCSSIVTWVVQIYAGIRAYQGHMDKYPLVGDWAESQSNK